MNKKINKNSFEVEKVLTEDFDDFTEKVNRREKWNSKKKVKYQ